MGTVKALETLYTLDRRINFGFVPAPSTNAQRREPIASIVRIHKMVNNPYNTTPSKKGTLPNGILNRISGSGIDGICRKTQASKTIAPTTRAKKLSGAVIGLKKWVNASSIFVFLIVSSIPVHGNCVGRFVNPITDICWSCLFPITIGGIRVSSAGEDTDNPRDLICKCAMKTPPWVRIGLPVSFWEPVRLVDVTRTPYCLVNLGGISLMDRGIQGRGSVANNSGNRMRHSFYHVHWYIYPLIYWLELLTDFICLEQAAFDVAYLTVSIGVEN